MTGACKPGLSPPSDTTTTISTLLSLRFIPSDTSLFCISKRYDDHLTWLIYTILIHNLIDEREQDEEGTNGDAPRA